MRIWSIACLMACLVLPVGAEPPSPEITPEEAKAIAKEIVAEILERLENDQEAAPPSEGEEFDRCASHAQYSNNPDLRAEHFSLRTDHLRPCPKMWKLRGGGYCRAGFGSCTCKGIPMGRCCCDVRRQIQREERSTSLSNSRITGDINGTTRVTEGRGTKRNECTCSSAFGTRSKRPRMERGSP